MRLVPGRNEQNGNAPDVIEVDSMLIRDFFAGCALQGIIAHSYSSSQSPAEQAGDAYELADAMMQRRNS